MANTDEKIHVVMFPWLAFGHVTPWLELAKLLAAKGHKISFISTPTIIDRLPKPPSNLPSTLHFVKLQLPQVRGLPQDAEATIDLPANKVQYLKIALDKLQEPFAKVLESLDPDWIFYDFAQYWVGPIAAHLGIKSSFFSICIAAMVAFLGPPSPLIDGDDSRKKPEDFTIPPKWVPFQTTVAYKYYDIKNSFDCVEDDASGVNDLIRWGLSMQSCDFIAVRSSFEIEPEWLQVLETIHEKPVFPVGQLPPVEYELEEKHSDAWSSMKKWLDIQDKSSVVYVAFGSEAKPSQAQLTELALGLELSGLPFFVVLRHRRGIDDTDLIELPPGVEERNRRVKALILLTFYSDQGINARVLEEKKIGYSLPRNELDGSFTRDSVAESLRLVMVSEEGKMYRDKAKDVSGLFGDRDRQDRYVDNVLIYLENHRPLRKAK
uniref:Glycosyltransferase subfamily 4-like N-terminal domain-containing protein n=1 Tax=Salix viminalis TaxID=40686 RepID=A0A6N2KA31_SALVM